MMIHSSWEPDPLKYKEDPFNNENKQVIKDCSKRNTNFKDLGETTMVSALHGLNCLHGLNSSLQTYPSKRPPFSLKASQAFMDMYCSQKFGEQDTYRNKSDDVKMVWA